MAFNPLAAARNYLARQVATTGRVWGIPEMRVSERIAAKPEYKVWTPPVINPWVTPKYGQEPSPVVTPPPTVPLKLPPRGGQPQPTGGEPQPQPPPTGTDLSNLFIPTPEAPSFDFEALIGPAMAALDEATTGLQSGFATTEAEVAGRKATRTAQAQQEIGAQVTGLEAAKTKQERLGESAANEARRQFAELQQGLQARYGGTTGTGAFAEATYGGQAMRNIAGFRIG